MKLMHLLDEKRKTTIDVQVSDDPKLFRVLSHPLRIKILETLSAREKYPLEIARQLGLNEQTVYYHIKILEKFGLVERKKAPYIGLPEFFSLKRNAFAFVPSYVTEEKHEINIYEYLEIPKLLEGFYTPHHVIDCKIVVGDPRPHGHWRKFDVLGHLAGDIAVLLGKYGESHNNLTYTDLDVKNKKENLIVIGGPHVNLLQFEINKFLPIRFNESGSKLISTLSETEYSAAEDGVICKIRNPFDKTKNILSIAGVSSAGVKAAVFAITRHLDRITKGNKFDENIIAKVMRGIEKNGEIVDVAFLE